MEGGRGRLFCFAMQSPACRAAEKSRHGPLREGDRDAVVPRSHPLHRGLRGSAVTQTERNSTWPLCIGGFRAAGKRLRHRRHRLRTSTTAPPAELSYTIASRRRPNRITPSATAGADAAGMTFPADGEDCASSKWASRSCADSPGAARRDGRRLLSRSLSARSATADFHSRSARHPAGLMPHGALSMAPPSRGPA